MKGHFRIVFLLVLPVVLTDALLAQTEAYEYLEQQWLADSAKQDFEGTYDVVLRTMKSKVLSDNEKYGFFRRSIALFENNRFDNDTILGRTYVFAGLVHYNKDLKSAIELFKLALKHYKRFYPLNDGRVISVYFHISEKLFLDFQLEKSMEYLDSVILLQKGRELDFNWVRSLNLSARIYAFLGDIGRMQLILQAVEPMFEKLGKDRLEYFINTKAGMYRDLFLPDSALNTLRPILATSKSPFFTYSQIGQAYLGLSNPDSALLYFQKQRSILEAQHLNFDQNEINWLWYNLAQTYLDLNDLVNSRSSIERITGVDITDRSRINHKALEARILGMLGDLDQAVKICGEIDYDFTHDFNQTPFDQARFFITYLKFLSEVYDSTSQRGVGNEIFRLINTADSVLASRRKEIMSPSGRQNYAKFYREFYDLAIKNYGKARISSESGHPVEHTIKYMESTKALVLYEEFAEKRAKESLKLKYRDRYEDLIYKMHNAPDLDTRLLMSDSIFYWLQREETDSLISQIEPERFRPDFASYVNEPGVLYLNYFQHEDTTLTVALMGSGKKTLFHVDNKEWYYLLKRNLEEIRNYSPGDLDEYNDYDSLLFNYLLPFSGQDIPEKLVIIPDGILAYFPFEVLRNQDGHYLLERSSVSYSFSLAMLEQVHRFPQISGRPLIVAPDFNGQVHLSVRGLAVSDVKLSALKFNRQEAIDIGTILRQDQLFLGNDATVNNFFDYCSTSPVIHIATHAFASEDEDQQAQILFEQDQVQNKVYLGEIFSHKIPANMVVMSACQTAIGRYMPGEGVMSFARAFTGAGSKSVVASLWSVNDESTAKVMSNFYRELRRGETKDEALRQAKLEYIRHADPVYRHPYFWAGFVAIGDMSPILNDFRWIYLMIAGLAILVMVIVLFRRKTSGII